MSEAIKVLPPDVEETLRQADLTPEQRVKVRDRMIQSFEADAVTRRIEKYFRYVDTYIPVQDCKGGHPDDVAAERLHICWRCNRLLDTEPVRLAVGWLQDGEDPLGGIHPNLIVAQGSHYRPFRGSAFVPVQIYQTVQRGHQPTLYYDLERFDIYLKEP